MTITWDQLVKLAHGAIDRFQLPQTYHERIIYELAEIDKQGANIYWLDLINNKKRFDSNPAKLVLPWLLKMLVVQEGDKHRPLTGDEWRAADPIRTRDVDVDGRILCSSHYKNVSAEIERLHGKLPIDIQLDSDKPDIDLDCLPEARDVLKAHAAEKYQGIGMSAEEETYGYVCPVGTWQTYKLRSALVDCYKAHGHADKSAILSVTTSLPDEVDDMPDSGYSICKGKDKVTGQECKTQHNDVSCPKCGSEDTKAPTIGKLLAQFKQLAELKRQLPNVVDHAVGIVGRIRNMGMHAGAIIIADRPLYGNLPLVARRSGDKDVDKNTQWISSWTEGRNTQLSKFGYIKWDILGLKNLQYIRKCCELIKENRGISFGKNLEGWEFSDPLNNEAGWYEQDGIRYNIPLNDEKALDLANRSQTDGIFQFDTQLAKQILMNGVHTFNDLLLFNAMGHPGPMDSIPEAVTNRNDQTGGWQQRLRDLDPIFLEVLQNTYGTIVFQEQLATIWQRIGGFTAPEAQDARKAVAKKWKEQLEPVKEKWLVGASKRIGRKLAEEWWGKMEDFGRYAFNKSHAVAYCLVAYKCLYLKAHFPAEWWAAVMSDCHPEKLIRYISTAKSEHDEHDQPRVSIGPLNINNLTYSFTVTGNQINQGLIGVKGIGERAAHMFEGKGDFRNIDEFVQAQRRHSKIVMERLIKLGSFDHLDDHKNRKCLWYWYNYKYGKSLNMKVDQYTVRELRVLMDSMIKHKLGWDDAYATRERRKLAEEYARQHPKKRTAPDKIKFWQPTLNHLDWDEARTIVLDSLFPDYSSVEILNFEKQFIGYYITNCMDRYKHDGSATIRSAQSQGYGIIHAMVTKIEEGQTKKARAEHSTQNDMVKLYISDGADETMIFIWSEDMERYKPLLDLITVSFTKVGRRTGHEIGVAVIVKYAFDRRSFTLYTKSKYSRNMFTGPTLTKLDVVIPCNYQTKPGSVVISAPPSTRASSPITV